MRNERSSSALGVLVAFPGFESRVEGSQSFAEDCRAAMDDAGRFLARRPRSERELREKLAELGYEEAVIDRTVIRLGELGLLDDLEFARQLIEEKSRRRHLGPRALRSELIKKGIAGEIIDEALESAPDEEAQATELAMRLLRKVAARPLKEQGPRLLRMLVAKGYSYDAAEVGVRAVLPPEGWD
jgi:regulatory protein